MTEQGINIRLSSTGGPAVNAAIRGVARSAGDLNTAFAGLSRLGANLSSVMGGVQGVMAAIAGGAFARTIGQTVEATTRLARVGQTFGMPVETLSAWQHAATLSGIETERLQEGMKSFVEKSRSLGVPLQDMERELAAVADTIASMPDGPAKAAAAMEHFGDAGVAMLPLLSRGSAGIADLTDEARRLGVVVAQDMANASVQLSQNVTRISAAFDGLKNEVTNALLPTLNEAAGAISAALTMPGPGLLGPDTVKQIGDVLAGRVRAFGEAVVETQSFVGAYIGSLMAGTGHQQAIAEAVRDSNDALAAYQKLLKEVSDITQKLVAGPILFYGPDLMPAPDAGQRIARIGQQNIQAGQSNFLSDPSMTDVQRREREREFLRSQMEANRRAQEALNARNPGIGAQRWTDAAGEVQATAANLEYSERTMELTRERLALEERLNAVGGSERALQWGNAISIIQNAWGSLHAQLAAGFVENFNGAISTISSNLTAVIMQTKSWGQALLSIGTTIMTTIVQSIVEMGVRWVMTQVLMATVGRSIAAASVAANAGIAAAQSAVWATPATLATIASYGSAAAVAPGAIALAQGTVMAQSLAAFANGGWINGPGGPREDRVMIRASAGEFIVNAEASSRHAALLEAINSGADVPAATTGTGYKQRPESAAGGGGSTFIFVENMGQAVRKQMELPEGRATIHRINRSGRIQSGFPT